jgi:hypothetical protein
VNEAVEDVKDTMNGIGGRRNKAPIEEKVTTIIGIFLLLRGLRVLRRFIGGIVLLLLGGLLFAGYFNKWIKPLFHSTKKAPTEPKKTPTEAKKAPAKKSTKK